jgi:hypothetical protein
MKQKRNRAYLFNIFYIPCFLVISLRGMDESSLSKHSPTATRQRIYHCTTHERALKILAEGLKSKAQLAREAEVNLSIPEPIIDHYETIYFQYIAAAELTQIQPGLWEKTWQDQNLMKKFSHCIAIEVDDEVTVYNPNLRFFHPFGTKNVTYKNESVEYKTDIYKKSGIKLRDYIEREKRLNNMNCYNGRSFPHPLTTEPNCIEYGVAENQTGYYWNEFTIKKDRIDPSEFAR